jgi:hypothetical protein
MKRRLFALAVAAVAAAASPAPAFDLGLGLFKKRTEKKDPPKQDPTVDKQLISVLEADRDEARRKAAAAGLRSADPKANFEAVAALAAAVLKDPSPDVRTTAAESLGGFKVAYQQAVTALERAESEDPDKGVRAAAKTALAQYALIGYKPSAPAAAQSAEPPLAKPTAKPTTPSRPTTVTAAKPTTPGVPFRTITQGPGGTAPFPQSAEPPLARSAVKVEPKPQPPVATPTVAPPPGVPQRMPAAVLDTPKADPPKAEAPSPLPLPNVPTLPGSKPVPTLMPPPK